MGEKAVEFSTSLSVKDCGWQFRSSVENGRGLSSRIGGVTAKLMGGDSLTFYTPPNDSPFAALDDDRPTFSVGVAVPKAYMAHANGTNIHMYVWERGGHRDVALWAHHSIAGASHATKLLDAVRSQIEV